MPEHLPAVADQIRFESSQLIRERRRVGVSDDQDQLAAGFGNWRGDASVDVPIACVAQTGGFDDLIFVRGTDGYIRVCEAAGGSGQRRPSAP